MRGKIHEKSGDRCRIGWRNNGQSDRKPLKQEVVEIDSEEHLAGNRMMAKMKTVWLFITSSLGPLNGSGRSDNDSVTDYAGIYVYQFRHHLFLA